MLPQVVKIGPSLTAANAALFAASQTPVNGTPLTLTGTEPGSPVQVLLTYGNEPGARLVAITGTDTLGNPIQQILAVPAGGSGTVATTSAFKTVTSAIPLGASGFAWTAAVTLGTPATTSPWQIVDSQIAPSEFTWYGVVTGTANYQVQVTLDNPNNNNNVFNGIPVAPNPFTPPSPPAYGGIFTAGAVNAQGYLSDLPIYAWRILLNSGGTGSGDTVTVTCLQAGLPVR